MEADRVSPRPLEAGSALSGGPGALTDVLLHLSPALMIAALMARPFGASDLFWQIMLGADMLHTGSPYLGERYVFGHIGEALVPNAWAAEVLFSAIQSSGGWIALRAFDAVLWLSGLLILAWASRQKGAQPVSMLLALVIAFAVALPTASARPQSFASPAFALFLLLIQSPQSRPWHLMASGALFVAWQNFHTSVALAVAICGALVGVQVFQSLRSHRTWPLAMIGMTILACAAIFLTPAGTSILELSAYNAQASRAFGATEWQPIWANDSRQLVLPVLLFSLVVAVVLRRTVLRLELIVPVAVTLVMTIFAVRFLLFYALALIPVLTAIRFPQSYSITGAPPVVQFAKFSGVGLAALALFMMPMRFEPEIPYSQINNLAAKLPAGTVFTDPALGGAIAFAGQGRLPVTFDGRFYLYRPEEIELLARTKDSHDSLAQVTKRYQPMAFVLTYARSPTLIAELRGSSDWVEYSGTPLVAMFTRRDAALHGSSVQ